MSFLPTTSEPLSLALFLLSAAGFLLALLLALRAQRAAPPRPNPRKEPFFALPPLPPEPKTEPKKSLTFDEEWLVPTVYRPSQSRPPPEPPPAAAFTEPPTRRDQRRRPPRSGECPFDVPTVRYPSSLSVARMYARSILQETGAR